MSDKQVFALCMLAFGLAFLGTICFHRYLDHKEEMRGRK